jgi:hypothetical protein
MTAIKYYSGDSVPFQFTLAGASEVIVHLCKGETSQIVGKFAYPAKEGYETLSLNGDTYSGVATPAMTAKVVNDNLRLDLAAVIGGNRSSGSAIVRYLHDITTKGV